jgi:hypothetical protein
VQQAQASSQAQAAQAAHTARTIAMMKPNPGQGQSSGQGTLKLMNFVDQLGKFNVSEPPPI